MDLANGKRVTGDLRRGVKVSPQLTSERLFFTDLLTTLLTTLADLIACKESHFSKGPSAAGDYDIGTISPIAEINDSRLG